MRDLLFGLDVQPIGVMPYRSTTEVALDEGRATTTSLSVKARRLRLPVHPEARVYGLPLVGSHVGADAAACLLATGIAESEALAAIVDIGTNTEAFLGNRERLLAASCPAGPAFEGGGVSFGMPALDGAIERVRLGESGEVELEVIGDRTPVGPLRLGPRRPAFRAPAHRPHERAGALHRRQPRLPARPRPLAERGRRQRARAGEGRQRRRRARAGRDLRGAAAAHRAALPRGRLRAAHRRGRGAPRRPRAGPAAPSGS